MKEILNELWELVGVKQRQERGGQEGDRAKGYDYGPDFTLAFGEAHKFISKLITQMLKLWLFCE